MSANDGGPAFPTGEKLDPLDGRIAQYMVGGMTLRDYFAAKAMAAIIAKTPFLEFPPDFSPHEKTALGAYEYADRMLKAREAKS